MKGQRLRFDVLGPSGNGNLLSAQMEDTKSSARPPVRTRMT
jgi:hypothetical protein